MLTSQRRVDAVELARSVAPTLRRHAARIDAQAEFPRESIDVLRSSGLMGLLVPTSHGGLGADIATMCEVAHELGAACLSTAMVWSMHCQQIATIVQGAAEPFRDELLPRIAAGEVYVASVTTERGASDLFSVNAPMEHRAGNLYVERDAPIVTGGAVADGFLLSMRSSPDAHQSSVSLVYAAREQLEIDVRDEWDPLGMRGMHSVSMRLRGSVPAHQLVGEPGGFRTLGPRSFVPVGIVAWVACWLGATRAAVRSVLGLLRDPRNRKHFDLRSDLLAERMARIRIDLDVVGAHLHRITDALAERVRDGRMAEPSHMIHLYGLKVHSAEALFRAADRLIQLAGMGIGYQRTSPVPLERLFRDMRAASLNNSDERLLVYSGKLGYLDREVLLP